MEPRPDRARRRAAVDGLLAATLGLAATFVASIAAPALEFPPFALADRIVRITPGSVATLAIDRLQHEALALLGLLAVLGFLLLGTAISLASRSAGRVPPWAAGGAFTAGLAAAELSAPVPPPTVALLAIAAGAGGLFAAALQWLRRLAPRRRRFDPGRRRVLAQLGGGGAALLLGGTVLGLLGGSSERAPVTGLLRPRPPHRGPFPRIAGLSREVTSVASHYVVDIDLNDPVVDAGDWKLMVEGLVGRPLTLDFEELQRRFPLTGEYSVLTCISNRVGGPLVGNSLWHGVRLRELLSAAAPRRGALDVVFECADGYTAAIPLVQAMHPSVLVAIAHNGRSLTREHGFPAASGRQRSTGSRTRSGSSASWSPTSTSRATGSARAGATGHSCGRSLGSTRPRRRPRPSRPGSRVSPGPGSAASPRSRYRPTAAAAGSGQTSSGRCLRTPGPAGRIGGRHRARAATSSSAAQPTATARPRTPPSGRRTPREPRAITGGHWTWLSERRRSVVQAHAREHRYSTGAEQEESERREQVVHVRAPPARPAETQERDSSCRKERTRRRGHNLITTRLTRGEARRNEHADQPEAGHRQPAPRATGRHAAVESRPPCRSPAMCGCRPGRGLTGARARTSRRLGSSRGC